MSDATLCPACGGANHCAIAAGEPAAGCWCMSQALDSAVAEHYRDSARCLCRQCGSIDNTKGTTMTNKDDT